MVDANKYFISLILKLQYAVKDKTRQINEWSCQLFEIVDKFH